MDESCADACGGLQQLRHCGNLSGKSSALYRRTPPPCDALDLVTALIALIACGCRWVRGHPMVWCRVKPNHSIIIIIIFGPVRVKPNHSILIIIFGPIRGFRTEPSHARKVELFNMILKTTTVRQLTSTWFGPFPRSGFGWDRGASSQWPIRNWSSAPHTHTFAVAQAVTYPPTWALRLHAC